MNKSINYHSYLIESLKDSEMAEAYLKAAIEENDPKVANKALRNVIEAYSKAGKDIAELSPVVNIEAINRNDPVIIVEPNQQTSLTANPD